MFKILFDIMLGMVSTVIQIICWPLNAIIEAALPDLSSQILTVTSTFSTVFDAIAWATGLIPQPVIVTLTFILLLEIAKHTIFKSTHSLLKVWNVFQKIKFW